MNSFEIYDELIMVAKEHFAGQERPLHEIVEGIPALFRDAQNSIDVRVGELLTLDKAGLAQEVLAILKSKPSEFRMTLTCGNTMVCGVEDKENGTRSTENHFAKMLRENFAGDPRVTVYYNPPEPLEQMELGYLHEILVDKKDTYFEMPHSYHFENGLFLPKGDEQRPWGVVKNSAEFALIVDDLHHSYTDAANLVSGDSQDIHSLITDNTLHYDLFSKDEGIKKNSFKDEREFNEKTRRKSA